MASAKDIVTYSHKLCYTTFAPPAYQAGVTVLHNFRPPMPQEWQLRASKLHAHTSELDARYIPDTSACCLPLPTWRSLYVQFGHA